jgi:hypothetical protein
MPGALVPTEDHGIATQQRDPSYVPKIDWKCSEIVSMILDNIDRRSYDYIESPASVGKEEDPRNYIEGIVNHRVLDDGRIGIHVAVVGAFLRSFVSMREALYHRAGLEHHREVFTPRSIAVVRESTSYEAFRAAVCSLQVEELV